MAYEDTLYLGKVEKIKNKRVKIGYYVEVASEEETYFRLSKDVKDENPHLIIEVNLKRRFGMTNLLQCCCSRT